MNRWVRIAAAGALVYFGFFGMPSVPSFGPSHVLSVAEPSQAMKAQVSEVVSVVSKMNPLDRLWLQYIYTNASRVVAADEVADPAVITTTDGLRSVHVAILKFIWKGMADNDPGKYAGLEAAIEGVFNRTIGDKQRALTPELREKACEMFDAIAWAGLGKDG